MIRKAIITDLDGISCLVTDTINAVYPKYYPVGAVDLYLNYHSRENIEKDIIDGKVYVLISNEAFKGTVTISENDISRLYVVNTELRKGYGTQLLDFAENLIAANYDSAILDSSLPAKCLYIKRGYKEKYYNFIKAENGDCLCYDGMEKELL